MRKLLLPRCLVCVLALGLAGCGSLDLNLGSSDRDVRQIKEIVCLWEPADGVGLDGLPTRGFAGQLLFFKAGESTPSRVDGDVRIYVFDNQGTVDEQSRPLHQFDFPAAAWKTFARETNLGPAYQIFVPYTRKGRHAADCAVRVRFTAEEQLPVYSKLASVSLPGRREAAAASEPASAAAAAAASPPTTQHSSQLEDTFTLRPNQTAQWERLRKAAQGAVQNASAVEVATDEGTDDSEFADEPRRYRMSGGIQQVSGVTEGL